MFLSIPSTVSHLIPNLILPRRANEAEYQYAIINGNTCHVVAYPTCLEVSWIEFEGSASVTQDHVEEWLAANYEAIESIGYEILLNEELK